MRQRGRWSERLRRQIRGRAREARSLSLAHLGLTYAASVVIYCLAGMWLDRKTGTSPLFTLIGAAVGAVGGFIWIYREVLKAEAKNRRLREAQESPADAERNEAGEIAEGDEAEEKTE